MLRVVGLLDVAGTSYLAWNGSTDTAAPVMGRSGLALMLPVHPAGFRTSRHTAEPHHHYR